MNFSVTNAKHMTAALPGVLQDISHSVGEMGSRACKWVKDFPKNMQVSQGYAVTGFGLATAISFGIAYKIAKFVDARVMNHADKPELKKHEQCIKTLLGYGIVGGTVFGANYAVAKLANVQISRYILAAITLAAVALKAILDHVCKKCVVETAEQKKVRLEKDLAEKETALKAAKEEVIKAVEAHSKATPDTTIELEKKVNAAKEDEKKAQDAVNASKKALDETSEPAAPAATPEAPAATPAAPGATTPAAPAAAASAATATVTTADPAATTTATVTTADPADTTPDATGKTTETIVVVETK